MWVNEHVGVNDAAARDKVKIYWNGSTGEDSVEQQIDLADRAIKNDDIGLILSPANPFALNTVVKRSLAAGMSVVIVGTPLSLKPEKRLSFVLNDEEQMGSLAADRVRIALKGKGEILIAGIYPFLPGIPDRSSAFEASLDRTAPQIKIVDRINAAPSFGQAELAIEKSILAHPHLSAILSLDIPSTRGAVAAVRTTNTLGRIAIVGCDQDLDLLFLLRKGIIDAVIAQNTRAMGAIAVDSIVNANQELTVPPYTFVRPVLITRDNIDDESIQHMLDWRLGP